MIWEIPLPTLQLPLWLSMMWCILEYLWSLRMGCPGCVPTPLKVGDHKKQKSWTLGRAVQPKLSHWGSVSAALVTDLGLTTRWAGLNKSTWGNQCRYLHIQMLTPTRHLPNHHISRHFLTPLLYSPHLDLEWNLSSWNPNWDVHLPLQ